ncbi:MAG: hypothetical protein JKY61_03635, partial [Planctomycetes bacterium]|nr:hypothetical protein [Planctomycetota bacterium]
MKPCAMIFVLVPWLLSIGLARTAAAQDLGIEEHVLTLGEGLELGGENGEQLSWKAGRWVGEESLEWGPVDLKPGQAITVDSVQNYEGGKIQHLVPGSVSLFRCKNGSWGYVKVLGSNEDWLRVERGMFAGPDSVLLVPETELHVGSEPGGYRLSWSAVKDTEYRILRSIVGGPTVAREIGRVRAGAFLDAECPKGVLVEYSVVMEDASEIPEVPRRKRIVRQEQPGEWAVEMRVGMGIDLLTGELDGPDSQVEVHQVLGNQILLRTDDRAPIALHTKYQTSHAWEAPEYSSRTYLPRIRSVKMGTGCFFYLPESGVYGRLSFRLDENNRCWMTRNLNLYGTRQLPLPPPAPEVQYDGSQVFISWIPPSVKEVHDLDALLCEVAYEMPVGSGDWILIPKGLASDSSLSFEAIGEGPLPLCQVRLQYMYANGVRSAHGESASVLWVDPADEAAMEDVLNTAIEALESENYDNRLLGKHVLEHLGERAWPRLLDLISGGRGAAFDLAREVLLGENALEAGMLEAVLQRSAGALGSGAALPESWSNADGNERLQALLSDYGKPGLDEWYRLMARLDPDPRVRDLALLLDSAPDRPQPSGQVDTAGLWSQEKPEMRSREPWPDWSMEMHGVDPVDGAATIRAVIDGSSIEEAQCLFALARLMESSTVHGPDPYRAIRLGLDLVEQYRLQRKSVLLEAAREGVLDEGSMLMGWRDVVDMRLTGGPEETPLERTVIRLPEASLAALQQALADLEVTGQTYVDLVLPAGTYGVQSGLEHWVDLKVDGVALIGEPGVFFEVGIRSTRVRDVILCNLDIRNTGGSAVSFTGATGSLRNLTLAAAQTPISLHDSVVELDGCRLVPGSSKGSVYAVRMFGPSIMLARACRFESGTLLLGSLGQAYLDRCLLDGGSRPVVQGQNGGSLVLRDSVILGGTMGFQGLSSVVLEGVLSTLRY